MSETDAQLDREMLERRQALARTTMIEDCRKLCAWSDRGSVRLLTDDQEELWRLIGSIRWCLETLEQL